MPNILTRAQADDLTRVGLDEVLFEKYAEIPLIHTQIFDVRPSTRKYEETAGFSGFSNLVMKPEGVDSEEDQPIQGYDTHFTHISYALHTRITKEMTDDDLYDVIARMPASLAKACGRTKEMFAASIFNNGLTATLSPYMTGGNGQPLFSATQPLTGGGTYQNVLSTPADLTVTSFEEAVYTMKQTVGDRGELLMITPKHLLVPTQLDRTSWELTQSSGRPDTANRADNWIKTQGVSPLIWPYLTDPAGWFLLTDVAEHNLIMYNRTDMETDHDRDFKSKDFLYDVFSRWSFGWADFRGVFASGV